MKRGAGELDALALARAVDELGGTLSVAADWDSMSVALSGLSEDRERLFEILVDVARRPRFEPSEAERARSERLAALERAKDNPRTLVGWHFARALYAGHRYGVPLDGTPEAVAQLGAQQARDLHRRLFVASNAILYWVGDVAAAEAFEAAERGLGEWPAGEAPAGGAAPPERVPPDRRIRIVDRPDLGQAQILVGHEGIRRTDPDRVAVHLMNTVLGGGGFLSRLMNRLRAEEGLTYGVGSGFSLRRYPGPFSVGTFTRVEETGRVVELLLGELRRVREEPPSAEELRTAKSFSAGRFALGLETSAAIAAGLVDLDIYGLPQDSLDTYRTRLRRVTRADTARLARERVHPERAAIVVVGPAQALRPQLERFGPLEVVEP
jgi:zinc protease